MNNHPKKFDGSKGNSRMQKRSYVTANQKN